MLRSSPVTEVDGHSGIHKNVFMKFERLYSFKTIYEVKTASPEKVYAGAVAFFKGYAEEINEEETSTHFEVDSNSLVSSIYPFGYVDIEITKKDSSVEMTLVRTSLQKFFCGIFLVAVAAGVAGSIQSLDFSRLFIAVGIETLMLVSKSLFIIYPGEKKIINSFLALGSAD